MATAVRHIPEADRVRANTSPDVNARIDQLTEERIREQSAGGDLAGRIEALEREWDFERVVETEAAVVGLTGLALALAVNRRFLLIPGIVTSMMLLHAVQGWYPLLPLFRRMGVRTQEEIDRERYALKALRGDFGAVRTADSEARADAAWKAVIA
jgi:hypothetical protein